MSNSGRSDRVPLHLWLALGWLILAGASSACSEPVTRARVIGVYYDQWNQHDDPAMLRLFEDGSYSHTYKPKGQAEITSTDRWDFEIARGRGVVVLHNFSPQLPDHPAERRDWRLNTKEDWGMIRLYVSLEPRLFYLGAAKGD